MRAKANLKPGGPQGRRVFFCVLGFAASLTSLATPPPKKTKASQSKISIAPSAVLSPTRVMVPSPPSHPFAEEAQRDQWDRGCEDWPLDFEHLKIDVNKIDGSLRVRSRLILSPEVGESPSALLASVERTLRNENAYASWVLPGINEAPDGGRYFVKLESLSSSFDMPERHHVLQGKYGFKLLWFEREGITSLLFREDESTLPNCPAFENAKSPERKAVRLTYRMIPREDLLQRFIGEIWIYPVEGGTVEIRLRIAVKPSKIVYELLPESMARGQLQTRGRRIWENFVDFRRAETFAKSSSAEKKRQLPAVFRSKRGL